VLKLNKKNTGETTATKNWYADRYQSVLVQRNLLSVFSLLALLFSFIAIFLVYRNIPIVTVEPFVIQVEPKTGITQVVDPRTTVQLTGEQALNNYFIVKYVRAYETVDGNIRNSYQIVRTMSEPKNVFVNYAWAVNPNNPASAISKPNTQQLVEINSVTRLDNKTSCVQQVCNSQVRADRIRTTKGREASREPVIIYLEYTYTNIGLTPEERYLNPLGFRVLRYRVDKEIVR
jgi:type IV secretion system protein VirB8